MFSRICVTSWHWKVIAPSTTHNTEWWLIGHGHIMKGVRNMVSLESWSIILHISWCDDKRSSAEICDMAGRQATWMLFCCPWLFWYLAKWDGFVCFDCSLNVFTQLMESDRHYCCMYCGHFNTINFVLSKVFSSFASDNNVHLLTIKYDSNSVCDKDML